MKGLAFGLRLLVSFLLRGKIWLKNIPEKMGGSWSMRPKASIKVISERHDCRRPILSGLFCSTFISWASGPFASNFEFGGLGPFPFILFFSSH